MKKNILKCVISILFLTSHVFAQHQLSLSESKNLALQNNIKSKISKLEAAAAQQIKKSAFTHYFPDVTVGAFAFKAEKNLFEMETPGGNLPVYDGNPANLLNPTQFAYLPYGKIGLLKKATMGFANIVQPIFAGGRIYYGNQLADIGVQAHMLKAELNRKEIILKTEQQYWLLRSLEEKEKTVESYEVLLKRLLSQVSDAHRSGIISKNDLLKVKLQLTTLQLQKSKLQNGKKLASMAFCQFLGITYNPNLTLSEKLGVVEQPTIYFVAKEQALSERKEFALLKLSLEGAQLQTKLKRGAFLPQAAIGVNILSIKLDEKERSNNAFAYATLSVPISAWWRGNYELNERRINEEKTEYKFAHNSDLLKLQMEKAWQNFSESYTQYLLSEEAKVEAQENMNVTQESYNNGLIAVADLLEARALLQQAQNQLTEAKAEYFIKKREYLQVTGR